MAAESQYIFVYGTLLKDVDNNKSKFLAMYSELVGSGYFHGKLYRISWFPGAVESKNDTDKVYGSLFKIYDFDIVFKALDAYEGIDMNSREPNLFERSVVPIYIEDGSVVKAWVYFYNHSVEDLEQIVSGDFLKNCGK
ncbi:gamma-glutamylcyclotransferase family protein [Tamlana sp. 2_MG-2023]|uniref:gamma-glutamylcyclotransferase family protein n=1 Tax=unclassified Tamlana TaxID=2614803 RepID=UPI0026E326F6|nr:MULTISPECIES: gamma-glutamylcyclotransferase family protein [unclassified Tamlana]MDO6758869.1 gamma-glutamylcyclotransferase family protein [Tamlana sp. 2_MG-2023]MDO6789568.1 gamma-glutamylcyclotransferase family protein [Tamlana sp. 1_MG-2023]